jgi:site-specific DNA-adenine methylase
LKYSESLKLMRMAMSTYPGGKNGAGVYQKLICQMPPHDVYIEPFLGGGAVMRLKKPARSSIGIDADEDVLIAFPSDAISNLRLVHADALAWLAAATDLSGDTLVYCDPPYLLGTRRGHRPIYRYELTDAEHVRLLDIITRLRCMVMISGYDSDLYASRLEGWRTIWFQARTRGGTMATEYVWMNYPEPLELHDYRYLGCDFRERERIKRKKLRWVARFSRMDALERHAMMSALADWRDHSAVFGDARGSSF